MVIHKTNTTIRSDVKEMTANIIRKYDEGKSTNTVTVSTIESNQTSSYVCWSILLCSQENKVRMETNANKCLASQAKNRRIFEHNVVCVDDFGK
jgi:biotin synthase-related radical SAM superfamily protein